MENIATPDATNANHGAHNARAQQIFSVTIFLGAALLFSLQLILGRRLLLEFGGVPAVWLTALFLFQMVLLFAYVAVLYLSKLKIKHAFIVFAFLLGASVLQAFFLNDPYSASTQIDPLAVAFTLAGYAAFGLFTLSLTSPFLQKIYSQLPQQDARDPYYLYAASNLGSFFGLLAVPLIFEPFFGMQTTTTVWLVGFIGYIILMAWCLRHGHLASTKKTIETDSPPPVAFLPTLPILLYSFLPAVLSYGATASLINDIAALPLLTMVPLGLYLLSFVIAFSRLDISANFFLPILGLATIIYVSIFILNGHRAHSIEGMIAILAVFFIAACYCHKKMVDLRPTTHHLPLYYILVAVGGAVGGLFSVFVVPSILSMPYEFYLTMAAVLLIGLREDIRNLLNPIMRKTKIVAVLLGFCLLVLLSLIETLSLPILPILLFLCMALLILWPSLLGLVSIGLLVVTFQFTSHDLEVTRDFFGVKRVAEDKDKNNDSVVMRYLSHGTTLHGMQQVKPEVSTEPLTYYTWESGLGDVIKLTRPKQVAALGMGVGSVACMFEKDTKLTFYEIDPAVLRLASSFFTFILDCPPHNVVMGDARLTLQKSEDDYDLILLDAFSSDSIPVHLLTREAFAIYRKHLRANGVIVAHISNRHLNLRPVMMALAAEFGMKVLEKDHEPKTQSLGRVSSRYVVFAQSNEWPHELTRHYEGWTPLESIRPLLWRDNQINIFPLFKHLQIQE